MRKLRLDMDALKVDSFETEKGDAAKRGTVHGRVDDGDGSALVGSCQQTCQFGCPGALQGTYGCGGGTAGGASCAYSCQAQTQCQNTCNSCAPCTVSYCDYYHSCAGEGYSCGGPVTGCTGTV